MLKDRNQASMNRSKSNARCGRERTDALFESVTFAAAYAIAERCSTFALCFGQRTRTQRQPPCPSANVSDPAQAARAPPAHFHQISGSPKKRILLDYVWHDTLQRLHV